MRRFSGGCLCGDVRLVATGEPYRVGLCHCLDCRKHHGALFHGSAIFPEEAVTVTGETRAYRGRHFCPTCGSPVFGRSGDEVEVNLGAFDAPDQFRRFAVFGTRGQAEGDFIRGFLNVTDVLSESRVIERE